MVIAKKWPSKDDSIVRKRDGRQLKKHGLYFPTGFDRDYILIAEGLIDVA